MYYITVDESFNESLKEDSEASFNLLIKGSQLINQLKEII